MPLRHLITLMIDVRRSAATDSIQKDHLLPNPSGSPEGDLPVREHACRTHPIPARQSHAGRWAIVSPNSRICSLFTISNIRRPLLQQRRIAFDTEHATSGGARRDRTDDLMLAKHALSQLSYGPELASKTRRSMVGLGRLELPTSRLSSARSNQLSYKPVTDGPATDPHDRGRPSATRIGHTHRRCELVRERKRNVNGGVPPMGSLIRRPEMPLMFPRDPREVPRAEARLTRR